MKLDKVRERYIIDSGKGETIVYRTPVERDSMFTKLAGTCKECHTELSAVLLREDDNGGLVCVMCEPLPRKSTVGQTPNALECQRRASED